MGDLDHVFPYFGPSENTFFICFHHHYMQSLYCYNKEEWGEGIPLEDDFSILNFIVGLPLTRTEIVAIDKQPQIQDLHLMLNFICDIMESRKSQFKLSKAFVKSTLKSSILIFFASVHLTASLATRTPSIICRATM